MDRQTFPDALKRAAQGHQYIMVGDRHDDIKIAQTFFSRDTYDVLKAQGVKHIFLETPLEYQRHYDRLSAGKITREQFVSTMSGAMRSSTVSEEDRPTLFGLHADLLEWAKKDGIKVHCANERRQLVQKLMQDPKVIADYRKNAPPDLFSGDRIDLIDYLLTAKTERMPDGTMVSPLMSDLHVAKFMQEKAGNQKAAVFYGALHLTTTHGMDELVGKDKAATVIVTNGLMDRMHRRFNDLVGGRWHETYKPDPTPPTLHYDIRSQEAVFGALKPEEPQIDMTPLQAPAAKPPRPGKAARPSGP